MIRDKDCVDFIVLSLQSRLPLRGRFGAQALHAKDQLHRQAVTSIMRLLNTKTESLEEYNDEDIPPYAILSHTWGAQEVLFQDINRETKPTHLIGYQKITGACETALEYGLDYVWIDTCCINKESSAELSEAINSMFEWYKNSILCFVYLVDVPDDDDFAAPNSAFRRSRWWSRGWTLQELLAPNHHIFFNQKWHHLFDLTIPYHHNNPGHSGNRLLVHELAGIRPSTRPLIEAPVVVKLSWAANRETSRREDRAYCLLGLVGIQLPLLYGEGHNAFKRLLFKIMEESNSHDIFLAGLGATLQASPDKLIDWGLLASSPALYRGNYLGLEEKEIPGERIAHFTITNAGLLIELPIVTISDDISLGILNCRMIRGQARRLALPLLKMGNTGKRFQRLPNHGVVELQRHWRVDSLPMRQIYIRTNLTESREYSGSRESILASNKGVRWNIRELSELGFEVISVYPAKGVVYHAETKVLSFEPMGHPCSVVAILSSQHFTENLAIWLYSARLDDATMLEDGMFTKTEATSVIEFLLTTTPEPRSSQEPYLMTTQESGPSQRRNLVQKVCPHRLAGFGSLQVTKSHISWTPEISLRIVPDYLGKGQIVEDSSPRIAQIFYRDQNTPKGSIVPEHYTPNGIIRARWLGARSDSSEVTSSFQDMLRGQKQTDVEDPVVTR